MHSAVVQELRLMAVCRFGVPLSHSLIMLYCRCYFDVMTVQSGFWPGIGVGVSHLKETSTPGPIFFMWIFV